MIIINGAIKLVTLVTLSAERWQFSVLGTS